ncbi:hypothetical protein PG987_001549 [Apiospora arundinis]
MDPSTSFDKWELSQPISSTKARRRRDEIVRMCAKVDPAWRGKNHMVAVAEHHVCRFLWELHHHDKMPEDRFCWLVDQVMFRYTETRLLAERGGGSVNIAILQGILGKMPPSRVDYSTEKHSGVWEKYEALMKKKMAPEKSDQKPDQEPEREKQKASFAAAAAVGASKK